MGPESEEKHRPPRGPRKPKPTQEQLEAAAQIYETEDVSFYVAALQIGIPGHRLHTYLLEQGRLRPREIAHAATFARHRASGAKGGK